MVRERARKQDVAAEVERLKRRVAELEALHEERLRTEAALRESEARARAFFESAAGSLAFADFTLTEFESVVGMLPEYAHAGAWANPAGSAIW